MVQAVERLGRHVRVQRTTNNARLADVALSVRAACIPANGRSLLHNDSIAGSSGLLLHKVHLVVHDHRSSEANTNTNTAEHSCR